MRHTLFLSALVLLFIGTPNIVAADEAVIPPEVQRAIDQIRALNGQFTLTPENTIQTITFANGSELTPEAFDLFARQKDLVLLHVADYRELNDAAVAKLTGLEKLRTLRLTNGSITDGAIRTIAEAFPALVELHVGYNTQLTDAATREIAKLQQLENLSLLFCDFSEFGIWNLTTLPNLRVLDIRGNSRIGDGGLDALAMLPALRSLSHRSSLVSDRGIQSLVQARTLETLFIQDMEITGRAGRHIRQMERVNNLTIFRCANFDSSGVLALGGMRLIRLTLRGIPITNSAMEVFRELPTLRVLRLQELSSVTDAGLVHLAHIENLSELEVWDVPITDEGLRTIAGLETLRVLMLHSTQITDAGLELLLAMPNLVRVNLTDNALVTPEMIQRLRDADQFEVILRR